MRNGETRDPITGEVLSDRDYEAAIIHHTLLLGADRARLQRYATWAARTPPRIFSSKVHRFLWESIQISAKEQEPISHDDIRKQLELYGREHSKKGWNPKFWFSRFIGNDEALSLATRPEQMVPTLEALWAYWVRREKRKALVEISRLAERGGSDEEIKAAKNRLDEIDREAHERTLQKAYDDEELLAGEFEEFGDILGERLIVRGGFHYIHARDGVGKSYCALQMAHAMCSGDEWLDGMTAPSKLRVLYVQAEMTNAQLKSRVESLKGAFGSLDRRLTTYSERFLLARQNRHYDPVELSGFARLESLIQRHDPDVVFVDPLISFTAGCQLNNEVVASSIVAQFLELAQSFNCAIIIVHHEGKDREKGLRGHSTLRDEASCSIGMWDLGYKTPLVELTFDKHRHRPKPPPLILKRDNNGWFEKELGLTEYLRTAGRGPLMSKLFGRRKKQEGGYYS